MKKFYFLSLFLIVSGSLFAQKGLSDDVKTELLIAHNEYRQEQGAPDLVWSEELTEKAQEWADKIAQRDVLMHSNFKYGENIYVASYTPNAQEVVDLWAVEQQYYNGEVISSDNFSLFGHYTQIIWSETVSVGCAKAVSKTGNEYWVCEYDPPGNYLNEKPVPNYKKVKSTNKKHK